MISKVAANNRFPPTYLTESNARHETFCSLHKKKYPKRINCPGRVMLNSIIGRLHFIGPHFHVADPLFEMSSCILGERTIDMTVCSPCLLLGSVRRDEVLDADSQA